MNPSTNSQNKLEELLKEAEAELSKSLISKIEQNLGHSDQPAKTNLNRIEKLLEKYSSTLEKLNRNKSPRKIFSWLFAKIKSPLSFGKRISNLELQNKEIFNYLAVLKREIEILKSSSEKSESANNNQKEK
jgi:hypothetical protein